jgi:hypothetical protein
MATATARKIEDAGVKIGGARKDWRETAMSVDDVAAMTDAERVMEIRKDRIWPQPDYAEMVAGGMEPQAAALIKILRDRAAASPSPVNGISQAETARGYVQMMTWARDVYRACRTVKDVKAAENVLIERAGWSRENRSDPVFRANFHSIFKARTSPFYVCYKEERKAAKMVEEGFPTVVPAWRKGLRVAGSPGDYLVVRDRRILAQSFPSEEAAWDWVKARHDEAADLRKSGPAEPVVPDQRPHLDHLERIGPDVRGGRHVTPDEFISTFGIRGVEFGIWLPDDERQQVLDLGWDACHDIAWALGIDPSMVGLGGTLSMAFGARGKGKAAAHYEAGRRVFNMTRLRGAGSAMHEYLHGLDHLLGQIGGSALEQTDPRFATGYHTLYRTRVKALPNLAPEVALAIDGIMDAMVYRPILRDEAIEQREQAILALQAKITKAEENVASHLERNPEGSRDRKWLRDIAAWIAGQRQILASNPSRIAEMRNSPEEKVFGKTKTEFYLNAEKLSGNSGTYWKRPLELFARAGESIIFDHLHDAGRRSDYLVHGVEAGRYAGELYKGDPYPAGAERVRIGEAFGKLMPLIRPALESMSRQPDPETPPTP